jgi:hypothetical protein
MSSQTSLLTLALFVAGACLLLLALPQGVQAQNYHYSNGWHPGKRSDMGDYAMVEDLCSFRPKVLALINKVIVVSADFAGIIFFLGVSQEHGQITYKCKFYDTG